jgi:hypothetical protein
MPEIPLGFSLDADDDGFILRQKDANGAVTEIKMSAADLHGLKATIDLWSDRRMSQFQVGAGPVQPIVAHPVARVRLMPDAVQENILLTVEAPSGEQMTLSFPLLVADRIAGDLIDLVAKMMAANPIKQ